MIVFRLYNISRGKCSKYTPRCMLERGMGVPLGVRGMSDRTSESGHISWLIVNDVAGKCKGQVQMAYIDIYSSM
jgi:hypothetical protein